jgi:hypothetical protein
MTSIEWVSWDAALAWGRLVASLVVDRKTLLIRRQTCPINSAPSYSLLLSSLRRGRSVASPRP